MKKILSFTMVSAMALVLAGSNALTTQAVTGYTPAQVAQHNAAVDCWMSINAKVYNLTSFIPSHPGGSAMVPFCGADATTVFAQIHNSSTANLLPSYLIGDLMNPLAAPGNLAGTPTQTTVSLSWSASSGGIAPLSYSVMRNGVSVGTTPSLSFIDTGLAASTTYSYVIKVADSATPAANTASSSALSVTTLAVSVPGPLTAPNNLAGTPSQTSIALSWNASTGGTAPITYSVIRNGATVGTTTQTSFTNTGLTASTTYSYIIRATDSAAPAANVVNSAALLATTLSSSASVDNVKPTVAITSPLKNAKVSGVVNITVSAGDNVGVTRIVLFVDGRQVAVGNSSALSFAWNTANLSNKKHTIQARATDAAGNTGISKSVKVKVRNAKIKHQDKDDDHGNENGHRNSQGNEREDD